MTTPKFQNKADYASISAFSLQVKLFFINDIFLYKQDFSGSMFFMTKFLYFNKSIE